MRARETSNFFPASFAGKDITFIGNALDIFSKGHYFWMTPQFCVGEPGYSLFKLLLHFGWQAEDGLGLLRGRLRKKTFSFYFKVRTSCSPESTTQYRGWVIRCWQADLTSTVTCCTTSTKELISPSSLAQSRIMASSSLMAGFTSLSATQQLDSLQ